MNTVHDFGMAVLLSGATLFAGFRMGRKVERLENARDRYVVPRGQVYHLKAEKSGHPSVYRGSER